ncbi:hypothetical protein AVEN_31712-1 [Araneus ventricosus]|uniref:Uncharacterized protein n=1 Tax=Araneus ventricosus TaxID=182803 RepID=A0A4Y2W742_ARAVE|nr:hypothetical protein AVEN_31712-1 [Araneus ventricosus]
MESRFPAMLVLWLGRKFYRGKNGMTGSSQAWTPDLCVKLGDFGHEIWDLTGAGIFSICCASYSRCRRNSKVVPMGQHYYYGSASNSLLARTADRTPKMFALQGDPNRSTFTPFSKRSPTHYYSIPFDV